MKSTNDLKLKKLKGTIFEPRPQSPYTNQYKHHLIGGANVEDSYEQFYFEETIMEEEKEGDNNNKKEQGDNEMSRSNNVTNVTNITIINVQNNSLQKRITPYHESKVFDFSCISNCTSSFFRGIKRCADNSGFTQCLERNGFIKSENNNRRNFESFNDSLNDSFLEPSAPPMLD